MPTEIIQNEQENFDFLSSAIFFLFHLSKSTHLNTKNLFLFALNFLHFTKIKISPLAMHQRIASNNTILLHETDVRRMERRRFFPISASIVSLLFFYLSISILCSIYYSNILSTEKEIIKENRNEFSFTKSPRECS